MSNKLRLQTNNTNLQALIDKANALPDAGGSGGSVETCTVTFIGVSILLTLNDDVNASGGDRLSSNGATGARTIVKGAKLLIPDYASGFPVTITPADAVTFIKVGSTDTVQNIVYSWYRLNDSCTIAVDD